MEKDVILKQEAANDGQTVYLYYDEMVGMYVAYGLSAYYTTMASEPFVSFSEEMQLPVALLRRENILYLRQSLTRVEHQPKVFYKFRMRLPIGEAGYQKWEEKIKKKHEGI